MDKHLYKVMVELKLYSYGPKTTVSHGGVDVEIGPDIFIAVEGFGTFEGVSVERRVSKMLAEGKDLYKSARKIHRDSTARGHASITTSLQIQMEVRDCSRALSLLLVAPPFGSYLQESQRRAKVDRTSFIDVKNLSGDLEKFFEETVDELFEGYSTLVEQGVGIEDARYILPLCTKTSLFISTSLENYIALLQLSRNGEAIQYVPFEISEFAEKFEKMIREISPVLLDARLCFGNRTTTYPYPNPYKPDDGVMQAIISRNGYPEEPVLLDVSSLINNGAVLDEVLAAQQKEVFDTVNPLATATVLEPMSLVAYHQAIRHRTVPTAVESIYSAAERALKNIEANVIVPPAVKKDEKLRSLFYGLASKAIRAYGELLKSGCRPSTAVLIIPQALRLYVVRLYNGFNLLHPTGFIATRTCKYAQWEERGIAYKIMYDVVKAAPALSTVMGEKCRHLRYCPEKEWCPIILKYHHYSDELHKRYMESG
ncbi:MAG: FAD-dependent thymidylate synthase [Candidatus Caldarchaeum sp.]